MEKIKETLDYINSKYSTDNTRQYITAVDLGVWRAWKLLLAYPEKVSAVPDGVFPMP